AAAYYPAQPQYSASVQPAPVMINPAQQQQQAPPPQQPPAQSQGPPKRERKPIRIRDPNQGGRDITEEIMSGGRSATTPTPPQVSVSDVNPAHINGESTHLVNMGTRRASATDVDSSLIKDEQSPFSLPPAVASATPPTEAINQVEAKISDTVDAPVPSASQTKEEAPVKTEELDSCPDEKEMGEKKGDEVQPLEDVVSAKLEVAVEDTDKANPVNMENEETIAEQLAAETSELPPSEQEPAAPQNQSVILNSEPETKSTSDETPELPLANGLPMEIEELPDLSCSDTTPLDKPDTIHSQEPESGANTATQEEMAKEEEKMKPSKDDPPSTVHSSADDSTTMQPATSVPKKKKNMKEFNKKEAIGDLLDAFTEEQINKPAAVRHKSPTTIRNLKNTKLYTFLHLFLNFILEEEDKANDQDGHNKRYNRDFLLGCQFVCASMHRPEGLPAISDVVLDKVNKTPLRPADPARLMNVGPDFTPSYLGNLGSRSVGGPRGPPPGPRRSQQGQRKEPRKIISSMSLNDDVQLKKAENAWKPSNMKSTTHEEDEQSKTQEVFKQLRSILNKLTPQKFQALIQQVKELKVDTEERLKGVIDLKHEIFEKKQKALDAAKDGDEHERLKLELEEAKDQARRRSLGNMRFIGELFKLKMLTEAIMHDCVVKLLKNHHDEESLECLCRLLSTIGKDLDFEKAKPRMDQYFNQMDKIIKERKTSSRIRFMLQDVLDLRTNNWVPRRADQGPKTIDQIHKEAEMEEQREHIKVQHHLLSKKDGGGRMGGGMGGRGPHAQGGGRTSQPQDEGWNTVPISKNRPIDATRFSRITKPGAVDISNQLLAPGGKGTWGSWGKGSSGGSGAKPASGEQDSNRSTTSTLNRFSALQQSGSLLSSADSDRRVPHRSSSSHERDRGESDRDRFDRFDRNEGRQGRDDRDSQNQLTKRSFSRESQDRGSRGRDREAIQCVTELNSASLLFVFVRCGIEYTLERSTLVREHLGRLLHNLVKGGILPTQQYYKGLEETLEAAEDIAIDIPHIWLYLAELITPMLHEGGIPMGQLFREISKPLVPLGKAGLLLVKILKLLCKGMTPKKVGAMWADAQLNWNDFLPEDQDMNKFVTEQEVEFTMGEESKSTEVCKKVLSGAQLIEELDRLLEDKASDQRIIDWVEANLDEAQTTSNQFIRALMTSVCQAAIICENPYKMNSLQIIKRASLLQKYLCDEQKELQALFALQALMVHMEQPANLLRMFFDTLYDEDIIKEEAFYKWESSKDPAEQTGKGVALKSVTAFFTWLREAEEESDKE
uniref:Eukaryotic translation initiation factor 4 gamma, 1a n=1 Tax=Tetraodon nigroviridis TaxID=99883 RepID=H3CGR0_TETNG